MNELMQRGKNEVATLETLAQEARTYSESFKTSTLELGRVFLQAKPLVKHGEWEKWLKENSGFSVRQAQVFMQTFTRFGDDEEMRTLGNSKLARLLMLPEGAEHEFMETHDVQSMSTREIEAAVKQTREEMQRIIDAEKESRFEAQQQRAEAESRIQVFKNQYEAAAKLVHEAKSEKENMWKQLEKERAEMEQVRQGAEEADEALAQMQEKYNQMRAQLVNRQSEAAKGDAERVISETVTLKEFASAVNSFVGANAQIPCMGRAFSEMENEVWQSWDTALNTLEDWLQRARGAMNTVNGVLR